VILRGEEDHRTTISESEQYYKALKLREVNAALVPQILSYYCH
jgi:dipeptidyl aminopeptidase/acylaminoacyl peptidase